MGTRLRGATVAIAVCFVASAAPPPTPKVEQTYVLHDTLMHDDYRWMELARPDFDAWMTAQNSIYSQRARQDPSSWCPAGQASQIERDGDPLGAVVAGGGRWFFSRMRPQDGTAKLFMRNGLGDQSELLVDPSQFDSDNNRGHIDYWSVAPDGQHLVYGVSVGGAEFGTLRVLDVKERHDLYDRISRTRYAQPSWLDFDLVRLHASPNQLR